MSTDPASLADFKGVARLFPLPNVVLFPFVTQGLHIFEARYRQMTADALAGDRLLGMVLLQPGWEADYEGRPALAPMACLGHIIADERLEDGRFNLQLRGQSRARLKEEVTTGKLYRSARVELVQDQPVTSFQVEQALRQQLTQAVPAWCQAQGPALDLLCKLLKSNLPLGVVSDIISFALPLTIPFKQELLENSAVQDRVRILVHYLNTNLPPEMPEGTRKYPPGFSKN